MKTNTNTVVEETEILNLNDLYVSKHDPKLPKKFVSTSTRGVYGDIEVALTFYISSTGKTVWGELRVYNGYLVVAKCDVKRVVSSYLNYTIIEVSEDLLESTGFSKVPSSILSQTDYRQAGELVKELLRQLTGANPALASIKITRDWRLC